MRTHTIRLHPGPFKLFLEGRKRVEARLDDDKRSTMQVGDYLRIENRAGGSALEARIDDLVREPSFHKLFEAIGPGAFGYDTIEEGLAELALHYSEAQEQERGVIGIVLGDVRVA